MVDPRIRKILVLRLSSLGDIVMTTAMLRCLRAAYPLAKIDMVVREDFADLIAHNPHLDEKIPLSRRSGWRGLWHLACRLRRERYDLIYDAHRSLRTLVLMPLLSADHKTYFRKHYLRRNWSLLFKYPKLQNPQRFLERFITPLAPFGVGYDGKGPEIYLPAAARSAAIRKVPLPAIPTGARRVGLVPSAQWPGKRWPLSHFRRLMENHLSRTRDQLLVFGGKEDTFVGELVAGLPSDRVIRLQGKLTLLEAGAMLAECAVVVANDTGLMHMADALGVPGVLFLGPTSGDLGCLPFHPQTEVLEHQLWCRPCSKNGQAPCIRRQRYCLTRTSVEMAGSALQRVLEQSGRG